MQENKVARGCEYVTMTEGFISSVWGLYLLQQYKIMQFYNTKQGPAPILTKGEEEELVKWAL